LRKLAISDATESLRLPQLGSLSVLKT